MSFTYASHNTLVFGSDAMASLEGLLRKHHATSVLLVSSGEYVEALGIRAAVAQAVQAVGATLFTNDEVVPNPRIDLVRELIGQARDRNVDLVLAAGGASAFDTAKAVGVGVPYAGDVWDFFEGSATPSVTLPVGVIATIAGSGSEVSDCAVLQQGNDKRALETRLIIPRFAIVDPQYSRTAPYRYQAAAAADLAVGFLEPYFTAKPHIESADRLLEAGFKAALLAGRRYAADQEDERNRTELHWLSATMYNHCFLATGSENDWTTHRIEHAIGGQFDVIHGEGISAILPSIVRYLAPRDARRYAQLAVRVFGEDPFDASPLELAYAFAYHIEDFFQALGLPTSLDELGVQQEAIEPLADELSAGGTQTVGNYLPLQREDVVRILTMACHKKSVA